MAQLETTVVAPNGMRFSLPGRLPRDEALTKSRQAIQKHILNFEEMLKEYDNWDVETHRGSVRVRSYEEMNKVGQD